MPHFIDMPHGISFDLEELLHYQVKLGESYDPDIDYGVSRELSYKPVVLTLVFKKGETLEIPEFEELFLYTTFYPALKQIEGKPMKRAEKRVLTSFDA